jgi:glutathione S-transferase
MPTLYHCSDARSLRALWTLEELGADYELVTMPFPPRALYPGYLQINPLGTVPTLVDGALTMTESTGICHYLADRHAPNDLRVDVSEADYGAYLNWLYRSDATLTFPQTIVLRYSRLEPKERRLPQAVQDYSIWFLSRLRSVEAGLEGREFLCADRFTIADIAVHYALYLGRSLGLDAQYKPNCQAYLARLMERPGFQRAIAAQADAPSALPAAD